MTNILDNQVTFVAPRDPVEEVLARIWSKILGVERVGIGDNFFELGGHSLLAVQLISRLRETFQVELPLATLFEAPTVKELAQVMMAREAKPGQTEKIARLLKKIDGMSAEKIEETLQQQKRTRGVA